MITLTRGIGDSWLSLTNKLSGGDVIISSFYVRPAGTTYGTGDGYSYENAWSGFSNIEWGQLGSHTRLYICGTHNEMLTVAISDTIINGDYPGDPGVVNHTGNTGITISSKNNVTLNSVTSLNALVNGLLIEGTSSNIVTNNCEFSNTGNQGIQHLNSASATHNNVTCKNNLDDGISGHDDAVIVVNGGVFEGNDQAINIVHRCNLTISGNPAFINNTTYDLWVTNATTPGSCVGNISNCNFTGNVSCEVGAIINMDDSTVAGTFTNDSIVNAAKSVIGNMLYGTSATISTFEECVILSQNNPPGLAVVNYHKSRIFGSTRVKGKITATHCMFDATGGTDMTLDVLSGGSLNVSYSIFKNTLASKFGVAVRTGAIEATINNCSFVGVSNVGRGTFSQVDIVINNCIYTGLEIGHFRSAGDSTLNNCCFFDCNTPTSGIVTNNNPVTGNPLFADLSNEDYSLSEGSPCIDAGIDTGFPEGIDTANWGDSENTPVVSTKLQGAIYDIGAYVK